MTVMTRPSSGLDALRRRLQNLPQAARAAVGEALQDLAVTAGNAVKAALPTEKAASVRVETDADGVGCRLVLEAPAVRDLEFGTTRSEARPTLRPLAAAAAERAKPDIAEVLRQALVGDPP